MPNVPIQEKRRDFMTDEGLLARACHVFTHVEFFDAAGGKLQRPVRIDTAAPFSIVPFSLWHDRNLSWRPLGTQFLTLRGQVEAEALTWLGAPCQLAETKVRLVDEGDHRTRPLRMVAKFPQRPVAPHMEAVILAGYNFLTDNAIKLTLEPASRLTVGPFTDVVGFLTVP